MIPASNAPPCRTTARLFNLSFGSSSDRLGVFPQLEKLHKTRLRLAHDNMQCLLAGRHDSQ